MAAGSQAQGSWQNLKGKEVETVIKGILHRRLADKDLIASETKDGLLIELTDGRTVRFGSDPDIAIFRDQLILAVVEIKGGIDNTISLSDECIKRIDNIGIGNE